MSTEMKSGEGNGPGAKAVSPPGGRRLAIKELNLGQVSGRGRLAKLRRGLSLFLAGMYTGESCAGTPRGDRNTPQNNNLE